jgi:hypothetical protein
MLNADTVSAILVSGLLPTESHTDAANLAHQVGDLIVS